MRRSVIRYKLHDDTKFHKILNTLFKCNSLEIEVKLNINLMVQLERNT